MLFAIDIDGTIAGDDQGHAYAHYLNQRLTLGIPEDVIETLTGYQDFVALEQVRAYSQMASEEEKARYKTLIRQAQHDPEVQKHLTPLPGAVEAIHILADQGTIAYITCRKEESCIRTQAWLARYGFPKPEQVFFCEQYHNKYIHAYEQARKREPIVLIDDHAREMILSFRTLALERPDVAIAVYKRLAVVAFGFDDLPKLPAKVKFPVVVLPSWKKELVTQFIA